MPNISGATVRARASHPPLSSSHRWVQGNCSDAEPPGPLQPQGVPLPAGHCILAVADALLLWLDEPSPPNLWLHQLLIAYTPPTTGAAPPPPPPEALLVFEPAAAEAHLWLTNVTVAGAGVAGGISVRGGNFVAAGVPPLPCPAATIFFFA